MSWWRWWEPEAPEPPRKPGPGENCATCWRASPGEFGHHRMCWLDLDEPKRVNAWHWCEWWRGDDG